MSPKDLTKSAIILQECNIFVTSPGGLRAMLRMKTSPNKEGGSLYCRKRPACDWEPILCQTASPNDHTDNSVSGNISTNDYAKRREITESGLEVFAKPAALPANVFYCKLQFSVSCTLNNTLRNICTLHKENQYVMKVESIMKTNISCEAIRTNQQDNKHNL